MYIIEVTNSINLNTFSYPLVFSFKRQVIKSSGMVTVSFCWFDSILFTDRWSSRVDSKHRVVRSGNFRNLPAYWKLSDTADTTSRNLKWTMISNGARRVTTFNFSQSVDSSTSLTSWYTRQVAPCCLLISRGYRGAVYLLRIERQKGVNVVDSSGKLWPWSMFLFRSGKVLGERLDEYVCTYSQTEDKLSQCVGRSASNQLQKFLPRPFFNRRLCF